MLDRRYRGQSCAVRRVHCKDSRQENRALSSIVYNPLSLLWSVQHYSRLSFTSFLIELHFACATTFINKWFPVAIITLASSRWHLWRCRQTTFSILARSEDH